MHHCAGTLALCRLLWLLGTDIVCTWAAALLQCFISTRTYTLTAKHFDEAYYNALHNACARDAGVGILFCLRSPFTTSLVATMPGQSLDAAALAAARSALPAAWAPVSQASDECPATAAPRATSGSGIRFAFRAFATVLLDWLLCRLTAGHTEAQVVAVRRDVEVAVHRTAVARVAPPAAAAVPAVGAPSGVDRIGTA